jgi:murein L,D-transpeptidase YafK
VTPLRRIASVLRLGGAAGALLAAVYVFDKVAPPLLAEDLPAADAVIVHKADRMLLLMRQGSLLKSYSIALGGDPIGHKEREGDGRTPEGAYLIDWRNPTSAYHLSLHISYPNDADRSRAAAAGAWPGGDIMIHGRPDWLSWLFPLFAGRDWTDGCIAVDNIAIEEIWRAVAAGTPIQILP